MSSPDHRSWVVLLGASPRGVAAVRAEGLEVVVLCPPDDIVDDELLPALSDVVRCDFSDPRQVYALVVDLAARRGDPELVLSFTEYGLESAALVSRWLGLRTVDPDAVRRTRRKHEMRAALEGTQLSWPYVWGSAETVRAHLQSLPAGQTWIVKPDDGTGSERVGVVSSGDADWLDQPGQWIAEPLADGPEFSIEAVSRGGQHDVLAVTQKRTTEQPRFVETGQVVPALVPPAQLEELRSATVELLDTIGVTEGPSHTEVRLDGQFGPVIIETHTRPGGDSIPELVDLASGRDQYRESVAALLRRPRPLPGEGLGAAAVRFLLAPNEGVLTAVRLPPDGLDGLHRVGWEKTVGSHVVPATSSDDRIGFVICVGADADTAERRAASAADAAVVVVNPTLLSESTDGPDATMRVRQ